MLRRCGAVRPVPCRCRGCKRALCLRRFVGRYRCGGLRVPCSTQCARWRRGRRVRRHPVPRRRYNRYRCAWRPIRYRCRLMWARWCRRRRWWDRRRYRTTRPPSTTLLSFGAEPATGFLRAAHRVAVAAAAPTGRRRHGCRGVPRLLDFLRTGGVCSDAMSPGGRSFEFSCRSIDPHLMPRRQPRPARPAGPAPPGLPDPYRGLCRYRYHRACFRVNAARSSGVQSVLLTAPQCRFQSSRARTGFPARSGGSGTTGLTKTLTEAFAGTGTTGLAFRVNAARSSGVQSVLLTAPQCRFQSSRARTGFPAGPPVPAPPGLPPAPLARRPLPVPAGPRPGRVYRRRPNQGCFSTRTYRVGCFLGTVSANQRHNNSDNGRRQDQTNENGPRNPGLRGGDETSTPTATATPTVPDSIRGIAGAGFVGAAG